MNIDYKKVGLYAAVAVGGFFVFKLLKNSASGSSSDASSAGPSVMYMPSGAGYGGGSSYDSSIPGMTSQADSTPAQNLGSAITGSILTDALANVSKSLGAGIGGTVTSNTTSAGSTITVTPAKVTDPYETAVQSLYGADLGRSPDAGGLAYWSNLLRGGATIGDIDKGIKNSMEYKQKNPSNELAKPDTVDTKKQVEKK